MNDQPPAEPQSISDPGVLASKNNSLIAAAVKFVDAATFLGLVSTALYFWGYIYYSQFCERLGVSFQGISLPTEDFLIVSWQTGGLLLWVTAMALILVYLIRDSADSAVRLLAKIGYKIAPPKAGSPATRFLTAGLALGLIMGVLLAGGKFMIIQATEAADKTLARRTPVIIYNGEGNVVRGRFIYLRDFGSALLVGELGEDGQQVVARRLLKAANYSGYSLLAPPTPSDAPKQ